MGEYQTGSLGVVGSSPIISTNRIFQGMMFSLSFMLEPLIS